MPFNTKSLFSLRSWLFYAEVLAVIGFVALAALYIRRGSADPEPPAVSQVGTFIEKADALFEKQDLVDAALFYWQALQALETSGEDKSIPINGTLQSSAEVRLHANLRIAEIYSHSSWLKDAKARLEHASRLQPEHTGVRLLRGKLFRDEGLLSKATEEFLAVLKQDPHNAEAHYLLGVLYQGSKQLKSAAESYSRAIENDPTLREISSEKAPIGILARLQLSRTYAKTIQDYQFLDREFTDADLAEVIRLESGAIRLLEEAHEKYPEMDEVVNDLVRLLFARAASLERQDIETRQYADALQVYERIVELDPQEVRALERMGEIYASFLGDKAAALEMYRKVYEIEPHPTVLANVKSLEEDVAAEMASEE
jgi:tetratricopeptide (TPR) repeat protein